MAANDNFFNWGYAMCLAKNEKLPNAIPSAQRMAYYLSNISTSGVVLRDYHEVTTLTESEVNIKTLIEGIINLAITAKAGDVVTLYFAMHGYVGEGSTHYKTPDTNFLLFDGLRFSERELFFLLKLFETDVRVNVIMDVCNSGTWLTGFQRDSCKEEREFDFFVKSLKEKESALAFQLNLLKPYYLDKPLAATVNVFGAIGDFLNINDTVCLEYYITKLKLKKGHLNFTNQELIKELRAVAFDVVLSLPTDKPGRNLWHTYYKDYSGSVLKCIIPDIMSVPNFDNTNPYHLQAMQAIMPKLTQLGENHYKYKHNNVFALN